MDLEKRIAELEKKVSELEKVADQILAGHTVRIVSVPCPICNVDSLNRMKEAIRSQSS